MWCSVHSNYRIAGIFRGVIFFVVFNGFRGREAKHEIFTHEKHRVCAPKIGGKPRDHEIFSMK